jgi:predicted oxidoreductase
MKELDVQADRIVGGAGLFMAPPEQRLGIRYSAGLALRNWMGPVQLDCPEGANPRAYTTRFVE